MDKQYTYGATCTWNGPIQKVAKNELGLPACPFCHGVLFESLSKEVWDKNVEEFDKDHPNYKAFIQWLETAPTCWPKLEMAIHRFYIATGKQVTL